MGFFSRQETTSQRGPSVQQEQLTELRRRARRRLIGALVIVLIAVIFVPLFLKSDGADEVEQVVQVFPPIVAPQVEPEIEQSPWEDELAAAQEPDPSIDEQADDWDLSVDEDVVGQVIENEIETSTESETAAEQDRQSQEQAAREDEKPRAKTTPTEQPAPEPERTDDGSVALALLEGRMDPDEVAQSGNTSGAAQQEAFIVQVAAYSSNESAQSRREQLASAGVSNAFIETGSGNSGTTYRLRVGPFESRQAAEAALTRLRSLGYDDSFIRAQ